MIRQPIPEPDFPAFHGAVQLAEWAAAQAVDNARLAVPPACNIFKGVDGKSRLLYRDPAGELREMVFDHDPRPRGSWCTETVRGFRLALESHGILPGQAVVSGSFPEPRLTLTHYEENDTRAVEAVLNPSTIEQFSFEDYVVRFEPRLTEEWQRWGVFADGTTRRSRVLTLQFVEDNLEDFLDPESGTAQATGSAVAEWLRSLNLRQVREMVESENALTDGVVADGSAMTRMVVRVGLTPYVGGPAVAMRVRFRCAVDSDQPLRVVAELVNAKRALERIWHGPAAGDWLPLVEQIEQETGHKVIA